MGRERSARKYFWKIEDTCRAAFNLDRQCPAAHCALGTLAMRELDAKTERPVSAAWEFGAGFFLLELPWRSCS